MNFAAGCMYMSPIKGALWLHANLLFLKNGKASVYTAGAVNLRLRGHAEARRRRVDAMLSRVTNDSEVVPLFKTRALWPSGLLKVRASTWSDLKIEFETLPGEVANILDPEVISAVRAHNELAP